MSNMFGKAFKVWREFDTGMASDPELIQFIQTALNDAWNEGYDTALREHAPQSEAAVYNTYDPYAGFTLNEIGEDDEFSLPRTNG